MNLLQLRTKFREISGRHDLVNEDLSNNGSDFFINEGRKFLDRMDETQKSWGSAFKVVETGSWYATFQHCRAIKDVWAAVLGVDSGRWQLEKKNFQDLMEGFLAGLPSSRSTGNPLYYSPCITRYIPEDGTVENIESFLGYVDIPAGDAHGYNSILLSVPVSAKIVITINGLFYSAELVNDTDKNYWSEVHPLLLISAAMRQIEVVNRNTQGLNDWTNAIATEMQQLGFDLVEELIAETNQMEG